MIFVFGGAYQGKLDFVKREFDLGDDDVFFATDETREFPQNKRVIYGVEEITYGLTKAGERAEIFFREHLNELGDKIVICQDISRGLVPMDNVERAWREENGRCMNLIAKEAERVYSVFCGIESRLK